jgi:hypothetical protein
MWTHTISKIWCIGSGHLLCVQSGHIAPPFTAGFVNIKVVNCLTPLKSVPFDQTPLWIFVN